MYTTEDRKTLLDGFLSIALKLTASDDLDLDDRGIWEDTDKETLIDALRVQSALLRKRTVELDGWTEAIRTIKELAEDRTDDPIRYNEVCALLSPRVGAGYELKLFSMILLGLDEWRRTMGAGRGNDAQ